MAQIRHHVAVMGEGSEVRTTALTIAIRAAGLENRPVVVHSSLGSFGTVDGGASAVVQSFLDCGCTVIVPTFTYECQVDAPSGITLKHNADPPSNPVSYHPMAYSPEMDFVSIDMGVIPTSVARSHARRRGNHPLNSFSALGPLAESIIGGQDSFDVYAPLDVAAELGGAVALLGVGLTAMTALHLAEHRAGRSLLVRWALLASGSVIPSRSGSCSQGFEKFAPYLSTAEVQLEVGPSHWRVFDLGSTLELATSEIRRDPRVTVCDDPTCARCEAMLAGGPAGSAELFGR
jgi:aminoglycoside 3-N-acetyltransferase